MNFKNASLLHIEFGAWNRIGVMGEKGAGGADGGFRVNWRQAGEDRDGQLLLKA